MLNAIEDLILIKTKLRPPNLFYYRRGFTFRNFGDELSHALVAKILLKKFPKKNWSIKKENRKLLAIGSIMHFASENDLVWGAGVNGKARESAYKFKNLDVRCVRGPRTRSFLMEYGIDCPPIYGDPALLCPKYLTTINKLEDTKDFIVIPHYDDFSFFEGVENIVSPLWAYKKVISNIVSSRKVISSSLHGIILAEAFGIPAVLVLASEDKKKQFKYLDYYEGTLRSAVEIASSFDEAIKMKGNLLPKSYSASHVEKAFPTDFFR